MGYFSFSMTFFIIIGGACFFLIGCTEKPKRLIHVADIPKNQQFTESDCDILAKKHELLNTERQTQNNIQQRKYAQEKELEKLRALHQGI